MLPCDLDCQPGVWGAHRLVPIVEGATVPMRTIMKAHTASSTLESHPVTSPSSYIITNSGVGGRFVRTVGYALRGGSFDSAKSILGCSDSAEDTSMLISFPLLYITIVLSVALVGKFEVQRWRRRGWARCYAQPGQVWRCMLLRWSAHKIQQSSYAGGLRVALACS